MRRNEKILLGIAFVVTLGITAVILYQSLVEVDSKDPKILEATDVGSKKEDKAPELEPLSRPEKPEPEVEQAPAVEMPELYGSVRGRVISTDGSGVEKASVLIRYSPNPLLGDAAGMNGNKSYRATSDADGYYELPNLPAEDSYTLRVFHPDYARAEISGISIPGEGEVELADVTLVPGVRIYGQVYSDAGQGIEDARVWLIGVGFSGSEAHADEAKRDGSLREVHTDSSGQFEFKNAERGIYRVEVAAAGYATTQFNNLNLMGNQDIEEKEVNFELGSGLSVEGRVLDQSTGRPIADALVKAHGLANQTYTSKSEARTNDIGEYKLSGLQDAIYVVRAEAEGFSPYTHPRVKAGLTGIDFELAPRGRISGFVYGPTGAPVTNYGIRIEKQNRNQFSMVRKDPQKEHPEGKFLLNDLEPGTYRVGILSPDFAWGFSDPFPISPGRETDSVTVQLTLGGTIIGQVVDLQGKPIRGAQIALRNPDDGPNVLEGFLRGMINQHKFRADVHSSEDGRFRFEHVAEGEYKFEVRHPKYSTEWVEGIFANEGGESSSRVTLKPGATIQGVAMSKEGGPLRNGIVFVQNVAAGVNRQTRTDNDGKFSVTNLPPGEYSLSKASDTKNPFAAALESVDSRKTLRVAAGDLIDLGVW
ncbi:MAG: carboxypeptidase-like regulatory domain-containing protein [Planctomycetota bacterium]